VRVLTFVLSHSLCLDNCILSVDATSLRSSVATHRPKRSSSSPRPPQQQCFPFRLWSQHRQQPTLRIRSVCGHGVDFGQCLVFDRVCPPVILPRPDGPSELRSLSPKSVKRKGPPFACIGTQTETLRAPGPALPPASNVCEPQLLVAMSKTSSLPPCSVLPSDPFLPYLSVKGDGEPLLHSTVLPYWLSLTAATNHCS